MENEDIYLVIQDAAKELSGVSSAIEKGNEAIAQKSFFDETLASVIGEKLQAIVDKLSEEKKEEKYFDETLGETISGSLKEAIAFVAKIGKPDMAPVVRIADDISKQNRAIIDGINSMLGRENVGDKYEKLFSMVIAMIEKNNEFIAASMNQKEYLDRMDKMVEAVNKKPDSWVFTHKMDYGRIVSTEAKPKYTN